MTQSLWHELREIFHRATGMILPEAVKAQADALIERLATDANCTPQECLSQLANDRDARQVLLDQLGLGTTWFMRDQDGLRSLVAALEQRASSAHRALTLWSVGCSTGEEPYTLAMAVAEAGIKARILATDLNRRALQTARRAQYTHNSLRRLPTAWRRRHFKAARNGLMRLTSDVRQTVTFELHNLLENDKPPDGWLGFDAIVCRNVLIYFERDHAEEIIANLVKSCQPGGFLLLGAIERPLFWMSKHGRPAAKERVSTPPGRDAELVRIASGTTPPPFRAPPEAVAKENAPTKPLQVAGSEPQADINRLLELAELAENEKRLGDALELVDQAIAKSPLHSAAYLQRGRICQKSGQTRQAIEDLRAARFLDRDTWLAPYHLARCLEDIGEEKEALEAYRYTLGVFEAGGSSGYYRNDGDVEGLAEITADACLDRIHKLS